MGLMDIFRRNHGKGDHTVIETRSVAPGYTAAIIWQRVRAGSAARPTWALCRPLWGCGRAV